LSRAKHGLYIFGNGSKLSIHSELWKEVLEILDKSKLREQSIDIYCQKHLTLTNVTSYADIPPEGGCLKQCGELLLCEHVSDQITKLQN
jgi:hypothetical protein